MNKTVFTLLAALLIVTTLVAAAPNPVPQLTPRNITFPEAGTGIVNASHLCILSSCIDNWSDVNSSGGSGGGADGNLSGLADIDDFIIITVNSAGTYANASFNTSAGDARYALLSTFNTYIAANYGNVSALQTLVAGLYTNITLNQGYINSLSANLSSTQSTVSGHTISIGVLQDSDDSLSANDTALGQRITDVNSTVASHTSQLTALSINDSTLNSRITAVNDSAILKAVATVVGANNYSYWNGSHFLTRADVDTDTTYTNGTGLGLSGTTFSVLTNYRLPQGCSPGEIPEVNSSGGWECGADDSGGGGFDLNYTTDSGSGTITDGEILTIAGAGSVSTSGSGNTITITGVDTNDTTAVATLTSNVNALSTFAQTKAATGTASCTGSNSTHTNVSMNITLSNSSISSQCVAVVHAETAETGDISAVTAGNGLTGGGTSGAVTLSLNDTYYGAFNMEVTDSNAYLLEDAGGNDKVRFDTSSSLGYLGLTLRPNSANTQGLGQVSVPFNTAFINYILGTQINATTFYQNGDAVLDVSGVHCSNITGGSDSDFCADAEGSGSGGGNGSFNGINNSFAIFGPNSTLISNSSMYNSAGIVVIGNTAADTGAGGQQQLEVNNPTGTAQVTINTDNNSALAKLHFRANTLDFYISHNGTGGLFFENESGALVMNLSDIGVLSVANSITSAGNTVLTSASAAGGDLTGTLSNLQYGAGSIVDADVGSVNFNKTRNNNPECPNGYFQTNNNQTARYCVAYNNISIQDLNVNGAATGQVFYVNSSGDVTTLAAGSDGKVLKLASGVPTWDTDNGGSGTSLQGLISGNMVVANGTGDLTNTTIRVNSTDIIGNGHALRNVSTLKEVSWQGLVLYQDFNNRSMVNSTYSLDSSGYNNDVYALQPFSVTHNSSYDGSGSLNYTGVGFELAEVRNSASLVNFPDKQATYCWWMNRAGASVSSFPSIMQMDGGTGQRQHFIYRQASNGLISYSMGNGTATHDAGAINDSATATGTWNQYCIAVDNKYTAKTYGYINGVLNREQSITSIGAGTGFLSNVTAVLEIGGYMNASLDDIMIFNRLLNSSEVASLYEQRQKRETAAVQRIGPQVLYGTLNVTQTIYTGLGQNGATGDCLTFYSGGKVCSNTTSTWLVSPDGGTLVEAAN